MDTGVAAPGAPPSLSPPAGVTGGWMPALQSLRGIAALWVVVYHLAVYYVVNDLPAWRLPGVRLGWLGVDLFFVLSAYLLGQPFFKERPPAPRRFLADRFLRVAPAYYVAFALAAATVLAAHTQPWRPASVLLNLLYAGNFDLAGIYAVNPVFWTLAVEMQFYLLLPLLARAFQGRWWPLGVAGCVLVSLLTRGLLWGSSNPDATVWATFTLPAFLGHFGLGLAAARLGPIRSPVGSGVRRVLLAASVPFILLPPLLWIPAGSIAFGMDSLAGQLLVRPLCAVGFTLAVLATASGGWPARFLSSRPLAWLGSRSYSLYLMHLLMLTWTAQAFDASTQRWLYGATYLALSLVGGALLHQFVERPAERWRRARKAAAGPEAAAA